MAKCHKLAEKWLENSCKMPKIAKNGQKMFKIDKIAKHGYSLYRKNWKLPTFSFLLIIFSFYLNVFGGHTNCFLK